jgi:hypothetical protein
MRTRTGSRGALLSLVLIVSVAGCAPHSRPTAPELESTSGASLPAPLHPLEQPIRAAYFYSYVSLFHLDSLANAGVNRAIVKFIGDSLGARGTRELRDWMDASARVPVEVTPAWSLQATSRLRGLGTPRRYTWGTGIAERDVACPLDSLFWRSALLDRANEILAVAPRAKRLALDLEIYTGRPHHYVEPCRCMACRADVEIASVGQRARDLSQPSASEPVAIRGRDQRAQAAVLGAYEEARLTRLLTALISELARAHPGIELGVFDLDRDSFVHRAMALALTRVGVATVDYTERTYTTGSSAAPDARAALHSIGANVPIVGGLWLKQFAPASLPSTIAAMLDRAEGCFVFTTFSLWVEPSERVGPYALQGSPEEYWAALRRANR